MVRVRRSLAGLLFGLASIVGSFALSGFWLQYTAFSPDHTKGAARAVLGDNDIKDEVARLITEQIAANDAQIVAQGGVPLGYDPTLLLPVIANNIKTREGSELLAQVIADAHAKLIGASDKDVIITSDQIVRIVGTEAAAVVPDITLPVEKVSALSVMREVLKWMVPITAGLALVLILLGFAAHPEKTELLRSLGYLLLGLALLLVVIGYVVPTLILPLLTKSVWVGAAPRLAADSLPLLIGLTLLLVGGGLGCLAGAAATKRRDRWSQPIRRTSYREERRWS